MLLSEISAKVALGVGPSLAARDRSDDLPLREGVQGLHVKADQFGGGLGRDDSAGGKRLGEATLGDWTQVAHAPPPSLVGGRGRLAQNWMNDTQSA
ncbi:hypothetical protein [Phenylobacterium sp.]|uniref:hypothetical protein n=1 Tax=Phenylobacterium sp. TaxID=1871053 RepID=UPI0035ADD50B